MLLHSPAHSLCNAYRGFQMLAAMGYHQGKGLGKDQSGRAAPVDVKLKSDRLGLGGQEAKKRKQQQLQQQQAETGGLHSTLWHSCMHWPAVCPLVQWSWVLHGATYSTPD